MKFKWRYWVIIALLVLSLGVVLFQRITSHKKLTQPVSKQLTIVTPDDYQISYVHTVDFLKKDGTQSKATIVALNGSFTEPPRIDIYEDTDTSYTKIYSFIPDMPDMKGFLLWVDKVTPITDGGDPFSNLSAIFISMSQTGADYWGSYPILIRYDKDKGFYLADFDSDNASADSQIKSNMGPANKTFEMTNQLNENDKAKSILAEGTDFSYPNIELSFYTGTHNSFGNPSVTLKFPVKP
jgi:hypothetical protein